MEKIKKILDENKISLLVAFFVIFILSLPLLQKGLLTGDDYDYHISRIQSIEQMLEKGIVPVKIHASLANTYGYGSGLFYSNLFLYIPAIFCLFGIGLITSYKIFIILMFIFMFFITYISIKNITEENKSALIGTIIIMLSHVLILNLYHRFALGEFLGYIFIVPVISGIYDYVYKEFKKPYLLFIGFVGLIHTHLISTLICTIFCLLYFLVNIKSTIKNLKKFLKLVVTAILVAVVTCSFWLPMIEAWQMQDYNFSVPWTNIGADEFRLIDLFGTERYSIGMVITLFMPLIIYGIFDKNISKKAKTFIVWLLLFIVLIVNFAFWKYTNKFSNMIQFKWRLLGIITVLSAITIALLVKEYSEKININLEIILCATLIVSIFFSIDFMKFDDDTNKIKSAEELQTEMYTKQTSIGGGREYLPLEVNYAELTNSNQAISNSGEKIDLKKDNLRCEFENKKETLWFDVPYIYYNGYKANLEKTSGEVIDLEIEKSEKGLVRVKLDENKQGNIVVWYDGTTLQKVSYVVSIVGIIICVIIVIKSRKISDD